MNKITEPYKSPHLLYIFLQDSLRVIPNALVDITVKDAVVLSKYQFERVGFFCIDSDSTSSKVRLFVPFF
jgi:hypothetical protein